METLDKYLGYNTYILGTTKNVIECLDIVLYSKDQFIETNKISLYNISEILKEIKKFGKYVEITRETPESSFIYYHSDSVIPGFDTCIYLSNNSEPLGYTEFINTQGQNRDISITIKLGSSLNGPIDINVTNSLSHLRGTNEGKRLLGTELNEYTETKDIISKISNIQGLAGYTKHIGNCQKNRGYGILNGNRLVINGKLYKLDINSGVSINLYDIDLPYTTISYLESDIVSWSWNDKGDYSGCSLTKRNRFGNPEIYTTGPMNIKHIDLLPSDHIRYIASHYIITEKNNLYDTDNGEKLKPDMEKFLVDRWDTLGRLRFFPSILNWGNIYQYFPELSSTWLDVKEYSRYNTINILEKYGPWFFLEQRRSNNTELIVITGPDKTLYATPKELSQIIPINSRVLLLKDWESGVYTYYVGSGVTYYTESARSLVEPGTIDRNNRYGIPLFTNSVSGISQGLIDLDSGKTEIDLVDSNLLRSNLNEYRRNMFSGIDTKIPDIDYGFSGLLFYKKQNILSYL